LKIVRLIKQALRGKHATPKTSAGLQARLETEAEVAQKKLLAESMRDGSLGNSRIEQRFVASFSQQSLWLVHQFDPASWAYNLQIGLRLTGTLNVNALERSLQEIVDRHNIFRTKFALDDAQLFQVVVPNHKISLPLKDVSNLPEADRHGEAYKLALRETQVSFDLAQVPLFQFTLIRLASDQNILNCVLNHIICDGWSLGLFIKELMTLYAASSVGERLPLAPLPIQYGDYAQWQRESLESGSLDGQIDYWRKKLGGASPLLPFPTSRVRPLKQTFGGASQTLALPQDLIRDLNSLAVKHGATLFMVTLAACQALLSRYANQADIIVGVPAAGRNRWETEELIGLFVNTIVIRTDLSGDPRFCDFLGHVRSVVMEALCNSDVPFVKVVEELNPVRSQSYSAIFQIMFASIRSALQTDTCGPLQVSPYIVPSDSSRFDLTINLIECTDAQWVVRLEYNTALFDHEFMSNFLGDYVSTLRTIVAEPQLQISNLRIGMPRPEQTNSRGA